MPAPLRAFCLRKPGYLCTIPEARGDSVPPPLGSLTQSFQNCSWLIAVIQHDSPGGGSASVRRTPGADGVAIGRLRPVGRRISESTYDGASKRFGGVPESLVGGNARPIAERDFRAARRRKIGRADRQERVGHAGTPRRVPRTIGSSSRIARGTGGARNDDDPRRPVEPVPGATAARWQVPRFLSG